MPVKLLLATHNQAKLQELKNGCRPLINKGVKIISLSDINVVSEPDETGKTFKENAVLKAKYYGNLTGLSTIADDGGLVIPFLNNEPGVKSRRWLGYDATDQELIDHTLLHLRGVKDDDRTAYLVACLCFYNPTTKKTFFSQEKIKGFIADKPSKSRVVGYPFRSLFVTKEFHKYYDELTEKEHQTINHRLMALKKLIKQIRIC